MRALFITVAAGVVALLTGTGQAQAQNNRSFVSSEGSDNNPCTLAAPCRTLMQAVSQTNANGEVAVLNTGGYGPVTINKSISIVNQDGIEAGITATAGNGVNIAAGPGDVVNLRGLTITGIGLNTGSGINFTSGATLKVENCEISGFLEYGISLQPTTATNFTITDTVASNNGIAGIIISGFANKSFSGILARDTIISNGNGLQIIGNSSVTQEFTLTNSISSNNSSNGVTVSVDSSLLILQSQITGNSTGLSASSGASVLLSQVSFFNATDIDNASGEVASYGNNIFFSAGSSTITSHNFR